MFKAAVKSRDGMQTRIARNYGADLLGKAMLRLDAMLDEGGADKRTQLNAIQTVLKMNRLDGTEEEKDYGAINFMNELRKRFRADNITVTGLPGVKNIEDDVTEIPKFMK